jgi:hypothetical protein
VEAVAATAADVASWPGLQEGNLRIRIFLLKFEWALKMFFCLVFCLVGFKCVLFCFQFVFSEKVFMLLERGARVREVLLLFLEPDTPLLWLLRRLDTDCQKQQQLIRHYHHKHRYHQQSINL